MICKELTEGLEAFMQRKVRGEGKPERILTKIKQYAKKIMCEKEHSR